MIPEHTKPILAAALAFVIHRINPELENKPFLLATEQRDEHIDENCLTIGHVRGMARRALSFFETEYLNRSAAYILSDWDIECEFNRSTNNIEIALRYGVDTFKI